MDPELKAYRQTRVVNLAYYNGTTCSGGWICVILACDCIPSI